VEGSMPVFLGKKKGKKQQTQTFIFKMPIVVIGG
jgi:hypothetical protein